VKFTTRSSPVEYCFHDAIGLEGGVVQKPASIETSSKGAERAKFDDVLYP